MKKSIQKSLRQKKRALRHLAEAMSGIDYRKILIDEHQYLSNLMQTNAHLLQSNNINTLNLF